MSWVSQKSLDAHLVCQYYSPPLNYGAMEDILSRRLGMYSAAHSCSDRVEISGFPLLMGEVRAACHNSLFPLLRKERKAASLTCTLKQLRGSCCSLSSPHFFLSIVIWLAFVREILISYQKGMTSVAAHHLQGQVQTQSLPLSLTPTTFGLSLPELINMESEGG